MDFHTLFSTELQKHKLWHYLPNLKVGEIFLEGGAKNVLAASARLGAASLTQLIGRESRDTLRGGNQSGATYRSDDWKFGGTQYWHACR